MALAETEFAPTPRPSIGITSPPSVADRAARVRRSLSVVHTRAPAATPRAPSTRPCPPGRSRARAGRSVVPQLPPSAANLSIACFTTRHRHRPRLVSLPLEIQKHPAAVAHREMLGFMREFMLDNSPRRNAHVTSTPSSARPRIRRLVNLVSFQG
jgi:hypothetical protein